MTIWLLLKDQQDERGLAVAIKPPELAPDRPDIDFDNLVVDVARFNGDSAGDAAQSVARGGAAALRLMARQYRNVWSAAPLKSLRIETVKPLARSCDGRSADLLYALATFLRLAELKGLIRVPAMDFAATGTLDPDGAVGPVGGVVAKIEAAIKELPRGSLIFYPKEKPEGEKNWVDEALKERVRKCGIEPREVGFLEEALGALGIDIVGWQRDQPPYLALNSYRVEHSPIFFGRDDQVTKFLDRLEQAAAAKRPGGLVEAASGAGKSSFVQAGLLARLRILPRNDRLPVEYAVWKPRFAGAGQAAEIDEAALTKSVLLNWKTHAGVNSTGFSGLDELRDLDTLASLGEALNGTALGGRQLVWVVDQFEELFTQNYTKAARIAFARFLAQLQAMGIWVIGTLRTEFKSHFMALADEHGNSLLVDVFENLMFPLARMRDEALGQMIAEPAKVAGVSFSKRADGVRLDEMLREEAQDANSMPLVGYALNELWLKRKSPEKADEHGLKTPLLTFEAYSELCGGDGRGRIRGVLGKEAEAAFKDLPQEARDELPRLLEALAVPVEREFKDLPQETRDELPRLLEALDVPVEREERDASRPADLAQWGEGTPGWQLIEALREKRLLITEPAKGTAPAQVRVVHEALFEGWHRARKELQASRDARTQIKRLTVKYEEWAKRGEAQDDLLTSAVDLDLAQRLLPHMRRRSELKELLRYVDWSLSKRRHSRRNRRLALVGSITSLTLALLGSLFGLYREQIDAFRKWVVFGRPMVREFFTPVSFAPSKASQLPASFRDCSSVEFCPEMIIPPAPTTPFEMGYLAEEKKFFRPDQVKRTAPIEFGHRFAISSKAISESQWFNCVSSGICKVEQGDLREPSIEPSRPMRGLSKAQADQYVEWLSRATQSRYRLPSEAEYEYAARAGSRTIFPWGDDFDPSRVHCRFDGNCKTNSLRDQPVVSTRFPPNAWGLYDMNGNVLQWMADCYTNKLDDLPGSGQPFTVDGCATFAVRGGSFLTTSGGSTSAFRIDYTSGSKPRNLGVRVVRIL